MRAGWRALRERCADARFSLGMDALYTAPGMFPRTVRAVFMTQGRFVGDADAPHVVESVERLQLRRIEVEHPTIGATIFACGREWIIDDVDAEQSNDIEVVVTVRANG